MGANKNGQRIMCSVICTPNTGHPVLGVHIIDIEPTSRRFIFCMPSGHANAPTVSSLSQVPVGCTIWPSDNRCIRTLRTRATLKFLWRMSRRRPARRISQKNNSIGGICRRTYCNPKQIGGILIAKLIVAEKPSVAMSYAKVLGATNRQDGYLEGNGYLVSWCVGHLVELAPPNVYDAKYTKWSIADLPILPQKWQYLVSAGTKKQFSILQKLMHRPDVDSIVNSCDAG